MSFEQNLEKYADVIVHVGMNVQPGQRVLIGTPVLNRPISFEHVELVRHVTRKAYEAGARMVSVIWGDPELDLIRLRHADPDTIDDYQHEWLIDAAMPFAKEGDAVLVIYGADPDLYKNIDSDLVTKMQGAALKATVKLRQKIVDNTNWCITAAPTVAWAEKLGLSVDDFWEAIFKICRVDQLDPVKAWEQHIKDLMKVASYLNGKAYSALRYEGPGTALTIGLPEGHMWKSGQSKSGEITYTANIPTEEVFTTPHKDRVNGTVAASMPLSYGGSIIDDFSVTFEDGKVVGFKAGKGAHVLEQMLNSDEGARYLGEVALVPHSSPISQSGILFYNTLYDENASCHIALGSAYKGGIKDGEKMSDEAFAAAGGNKSMIHVDFMIGSDRLNVYGVKADGSEEPVLVNGEWAFEV